MDQNCIFCKIANKEIPGKIVYEDDVCMAFLDLSQVTDGHTLVIPKKHVDNILAFDEEYNKNFQKESNYYIPAEVEERAYPVREGDIWELSKDNFSGVPTVGATITSIADKKWVIG